MNKAVKIVVIALGGLLVLFIALAVTLTLLFDPNDYKGEIVKLVKDKTGRELKIEGKLGWSFFPWIGIETGKLTLGNAPGFGPEPFARVDAAGASVKLLPLLRRDVVVDTVRLDGLKLNLARNAAGRSNWDDLVESSGPSKPAEQKKPAGGPALGAIGVNKIDIRNSDITWNDQKTGTRYAVRNLELKTGKILAGTPADVQLAFDLESGKPAVRSRVKLGARAGLDLGSQTLNVADLSLSLGDLSLHADLQGKKVFDAPAFNGAVEIASFNPRALLIKLGTSVETADKSALTKLALKSKFAATTENLELKDMVATLDDSRLSGTLAVRNFAQPSHRFDLTLDQIDLDRYFPPAAPAAAKIPAAAAVAPVELPLSTLRALALQGKLRIQKLKVMNLHSSDVTIQVSADRGLITLGPNLAKLYNGKYAGRTTLDARGKTPQLSLDESVSGVALALALKDALNFDKFTGTADLKAKLTAQGFDADQIKQTLNGNAAFTVNKGAIKGMDLKAMIDSIKGLQRDNVLQKLTELKPKSGDETPFTQLSGTAQVKNGVVHNDDLKVQSPGLVNVTGRGSANLPQETLDYRVTVEKYAVIISGPFSDLKYRVDASALIQEKVEQKKEKVERKLEQKLKDKLKFFK
ncbi:MAG: AsmA family protein [Sulfuricaulis sp.]|nr:AsmA family protein [Sulfuricaulis sp.]